MDKRHLLHVTIYGSALSPCGKYLAVGNNFGYISVFNIVNALSSQSLKKAVCVFKAHSGPIYALETTSKCLMSAGYGPIIGWKWSDIINNKPKKFYSLSRESEHSKRSNCCESYNCLSYNAKDNQLFAGGNDCIVTVWDLNTSLPTEGLNGHDAYIHDVGIAINNLVSASEDGSVKVWDIRSNDCIGSIEPYKQSELSRPKLGKWVSSVAVDSNGQWMACGGGPRSSLWHLRSRSLISTLNDETLSTCNSELSANTIKFLNDEIIAGGNQPNIHRWHVNGQSKTVVPCTINNIFSLSFKSGNNTSGLQLPMIVTGTSPDINVFTNLGYLGTSLSIA